MPASYNRLFIMRHAESLEDIDKTAYERIADENMPLSDVGKSEARDFGESFYKEHSPERLRIILAPSHRVLETAQIVVSAFPTSVSWSLRTDPLIRKQDWGDVTIHNRAAIEKQRYEAGVLRYKFPGGESGAEMLARFDTFSNTLRQEMQIHPDENILVVTHGFEMRVLLKSLLGWSEDYFESLAHPNHCEMKRLILHPGGVFQPLDEMRIHDLSKNPNFIRRKPDSEISSDIGI